MKKLLFASLLTVAVVFAQTGGGTTDKKEPRTTEANNKPGGKTKPREHSKKGSKTVTENAPKIASGSGGHVGGGSGAGKVSTTESTKKFGGSHGCDTPTESTAIAKTYSKKGGKKGVNKAGQQPPAKRPEAAPPAK